MSALPWWKLEHKTKHPRVNRDTRVYIGSGQYKDLPKGAFISPVRRVFLPYDHWILNGNYDETDTIAADTPTGFGLVPLDAVDW